MRPSGRQLSVVVVLAFVGSVFLSSPGGAQDPPVRFVNREPERTAEAKRLRVLKTVVVVEEPRGDAAVVDTVPPGAVFELLEERDSWYLIRPPDDGGTWVWATGWINAALMEVLPSQLSGRELREAAPRPTVDVPVEKAGPAAVALLHGQGLRKTERHAFVVFLAAAKDTTSRSSCLP